MMMSHAYIIARAGRASEVLPLAERAVAVNPYAPAFYKVLLAFVCFLAGEPEKALAALRTVQATIGQSRIIKIASLAALGRVEEARAEARQLLGETPDATRDGVVASCSLASEADRARLERRAGARRALNEKPRRPRGGPARNPRPWHPPHGGGCDGPKPYRLIVRSALRSALASSLSMSPSWMIAWSATTRSSITA